MMMRSVTCFLCPAYFGRAEHCPGKAQGFAVEWKSQMRPFGHLKKAYNVWLYLCFPMFCNVI